MGSPSYLPWRRLDAAPVRHGWLDGIALAAILLGTVLRLRHWMSGRSLWLDEAYLALALAERGWSTLHLPLGYDQMAPLGFLALTNRGLRISS